MDESKSNFLNLYSRADDAWDHKDFEEAAQIYLQILQRDNTEYEAHFGVVLCKYGITYETDPVTRKKMPSCNRINRDSILDDEHYIAAIKYAPKQKAELFKQQATEIDRISTEFLKIVDQEEPYDVFISYKKAAEDGSLTKDSKVARKLYYHLKDKGFNVFFAEETLKNVPDLKYEPYIFASISSAPVMVVVGSRREYFEATWVKNEWRRFLAMMQQGRKKTLLKAYFDMDPYHLPAELNDRFAFDANDITFHEDITEIVRKKVADAKDERALFGKHGMSLREKYASREKIDKLIGATDCDMDFAANVLIQCHGDVKKAQEFIEEDPGYQKSLWVCVECKSHNTHDNCRKCGITKKESQEVAHAREIMKQRDRKRSAEYKAKRKKLILIVAAIVLVIGATVGVFAVINNNKISAVEVLIAKIPANISEYSFFEQEILDAYLAYSQLDPSLQKQVDNRDLLLNCMDGFNKYRVEQMRIAMGEVNEESVKSTDILARLYGYYSTITNEQKALLKAEEFSALEQYAFTYMTVNGINALKDDVVGKYGNLSDIKTNYSKLKDEYKALVYNYDFLDTVDDVYSLQSSLVFTESNGGWSVSVKPENVTVLKGDVVIPDTYQGRAVTTIPEKGFAGCTAITSVTVPDSVTYIGKAAFSGCIKLQSIILPFVGNSRSSTEYNGHFGIIFGTDSYTGGTKTTQYYNSYYSYSYYIPGQLKSVTITDATMLSYGAFYNCSMLTEINLNDEIIAANEVVFCGCSGIKEINIPGLTVISRAMFSGCSSLEKLTLNENVTEIQGSAFYGCMNLKSINSDVEGEFIIPDSVTFIGDGAFSGCIMLQSITLPFVGNSRSATETDGVFGAIFGTDSYTGGTKTAQYYSNYYSNSYYIPNQLKSVTITDATMIGYGAFYNCTMIKTLKINAGAKNNVGTNAFKNCKTPTLI